MWLFKTLGIIGAVTSIGATTISCTLFKNETEKFNDTIQERIDSVFRYSKFNNAEHAIKAIKEINFEKVNINLVPRAEAKPKEFEDQMLTITIKVVKGSTLPKDIKTSYDAQWKMNTFVENENLEQLPDIINNFFNDPEIKINALGWFPENTLKNKLNPLMPEGIVIAKIKFISKEEQKLEVTIAANKGYQLPLNAEKDYQAIYHN